MAYPAHATYPQAPSSRQTYLSNNKFDIAADGTPRGKTAYSEDPCRFKIDHMYLTETKKNAILAHYDSNKTATFTFNYAADSTDYTVSYEKRPTTVWIAPDVWNVTSNMVGV